jgi:Ala-tRNA(Pro) deacylase
VVGTGGTGVNTETDINAPGEADGRVAERLRAFLRDHAVAFREIEHPPTLTSQDSANVRGEPLAIGGKALLLKVEDRFALFVLSAARKLDNAAVRHALGARKARFATREELWSSTGLVPGCVPPFGEPVLPFVLYVDPSTLEQPRIAFNAGLLTRSFVLQMGDWVSVAKPQTLRFSISE